MKRRRYLCSRLQIINEFMKHADCIQIEVCAVCTNTRADMVEDLSVHTTGVIIPGGKMFLSAKEQSKAVPATNNFQADENRYR